MKRWIFKFMLVLAAGALLDVGDVPRAHAEPGKRKDAVPEYLVKAAFLYNFARFTEWPSSAFDSPRAPVRLCIVGRGPFGRAFDAVNGKMVGNRSVRVIHLVWADEARQCHVLFLSASTRGRVTKLFKILGRKPVLTVSDWPNLVNFGSVIGFEIVTRKVRFHINADAAEKAGLKVSSRLIKLAVSVRKGSKSGLAQRTNRGTRGP